MTGPLVGRLVLVVEDEPFVALDVADCLQAAGAQVRMARTFDRPFGKLPPVNFQRRFWTTDYMMAIRPRFASC